MLTTWLRVTTLPPSEIAAAAHGLDIVLGSDTAFSPSSTTFEILGKRGTALLKAAAPFIIQIWPRGSNGVLLSVRKRAQVPGHESPIPATESLAPQVKKWALEHIQSHLLAAKIISPGVVLPSIVRWVWRQRIAHEEVLLRQDCLQKKGKTLCDSDNELLKRKAESLEAWKSSPYGQLWSNNKRGEPPEILPLRQVQAQHISRHIPCIPCFTLHNQLSPLSKVASSTVCMH